jgi:hypothetical protein
MPIATIGRMLPDVSRVSRFLEVGSNSTVHFRQVCTPEGARFGAEI